MLQSIQMLNQDQVRTVLQACVQQRGQFVGIKHRGVQTAAMAAPPTGPPVSTRARGVQVSGPEKRDIGIGEDLAVPVGLPAGGAVPHDGDHPLRAWWLL